ncbi:substrate-binding domain-containing protein [Rhodobacteraceae bacterium 2CG4]|uniref:Substrate-binding domain-containing protein n=1 Tax=Halovulum marinum TaxID=2662447 RepID=A0A6L5YZ80_9RHOB|nr:substrate-binding domain-containing protein [Halovulum marinum]
MRPTIHDVARTAGVSLSTVDRVLNGRPGVRSSTLARVAEAMRELGYERDIAAANLSKQRIYRFSFIIPEGPNTFMRGLQSEIEGFSAEAARNRVEIRVETVPPFDGAALVSRLEALNPAEVDGVAVVATDDARVADAFARAVRRGIQVITLVSDLPASDRRYFVGVDNVVAGRTAAGLLGRFCRDRPGRIAVVAGSMVVRDHAERRLGFEQVMRGEFSRLEVHPTIEGRDDADIVARELGSVLERHPDVVGIYSLGAGNRGIIRAVSAVTPDIRPAIVVHELTPHTREALLSGLFDAAINQNAAREVRSAVRILRALIDGAAIDRSQENIGVEIFLRDNLP